jgi:hypothetical protein
MAWLGAMFTLALMFNDPAVLGALLVALLVTARAAKLTFRDLRPYLFLSLWLTALSVAIWRTYATVDTCSDTSGSSR